METEPIRGSHISYKTLAEEVLCQLRGELSQRQLSEKLGYTFNQIGKWESGAVRIKWDDFLRLAQVVNVPIEQGFRHLFWNFDGEFGATRSIRSLIQHFYLKTIRGPWSPHSMKKWLRGDSFPDLCAVFEMLA